MISAEQARKNVEQYTIRDAEAKRQAAAAFVEKNIEPKILEASMHGENEVVVNIGDCTDALSEVMGMIHEAGFQTECSRCDSALRITWYANGTPTARNAVKAVVVLP